MSKKFDEHQRILATLTQVHTNRVTAKAEIRAEVERAYEAKMFELKLQEATLMAEGLDSGISKSKLGRAVGTSDWKTITELIALGQSMRPVEVVQSSQYSWSQIHTHPTSKKLYTFLYINGDEHVTTDNGFADPHMLGEGYLYFNPGDGWRPNPGDKPDEAAQLWATQNNPEED